MNELRLQSLVVSAVRQNGGFAFKMANRFLVGVPDLLIQIPGNPTFLYEVKRANEPWAGTRIKLGVTPHQYSFLDRFDKAGGHCGVISFLVGRNHLFAGIFDMPTVHRGVYSNATHYTELPRGHREEVIYRLLLRELDRYRSAPAEQGFVPRGLSQNSQSNPEVESDLTRGAGVD